MAEAAAGTYIVQQAGKYVLHVVPGSEAKSVRACVAAGTSATALASVGDIVTLKKKVGSMGSKGLVLFAIHFRGYGKIKVPQYYGMPLTEDGLVPAAVAAKGAMVHHHTHFALFNKTRRATAVEWAAASASWLEGATAVVVVEEEQLQRIVMDEKKKGAVDGKAAPKRQPRRRERRRD